ncbi:MAG: hypothetical protein ACTSSH_08960 [Candidatus Heimdallarchaeota archaeon]
MLELHKIFPKTQKIYEKFLANPTVKNASMLGHLISSSKESLDNKKQYYTHLFQLPMISEVDAVMNTWAVAIMLEDAIPVAQKIQAVKDMLNDPFIPNDILTKWVVFIWKTKRVPSDILDFISTDIKHSNRISAKAKKLIK